MGDYMPRCVYVCVCVIVLFCAGQFCAVQFARALFKAFCSVGRGNFLLQAGSRRSRPHLQADVSPCLARMLCSPLRSGRLDQKDMLATPLPALSAYGTMAGARNAAARSPVP